jgi:hypothetical protein
MTTKNKNKTCRKRKAIQRTVGNVHSSQEEGNLKL